MNPTLPKVPGYRIRILLFTAVLVVLYQTRYCYGLSAIAKSFKQEGAAINTTERRRSGGKDNARIVAETSYAGDPCPAACTS